MSIKPCFFLLFTLAATELAVADCNNAIPKTTPDEAFTLHDNGTVTHNKTGLMWMRCQLGQTWDGTTCSGTPQTYQWKTALQAADGTTFAGYSDWRVPNKKELASIVERACFNPAINSSAFPNASASVVWSSSPYAYGSFDAWYVYFLNGNVDGSSGTSNGLVRLVAADSDFWFFEIRLLGGITRVADSLRIPPGCCTMTALFTLEFQAIRRNRFTGFRRMEAMTAEDLSTIRETAVGSKTLVHEVG